jgi:hypothetical protein
MSTVSTFLLILALPLLRLPSLSSPSPSPFGFDSTSCCIISTKRSCVSFLFFPQLGFLLSLIVQLAWLPTLLWKQHEFLFSPTTPFILPIRFYFNTNDALQHTEHTFRFFGPFPFRCRLRSTTPGFPTASFTTNPFTTVSWLCQYPALRFSTQQDLPPFLYTTQTPSTTQLLESNPSARCHSTSSRELTIFCLPNLT